VPYFNLGRCSDFEISSFGGLCPLVEHLATITTVS
jgi:hypothetical protein